MATPDSGDSNLLKEPGNEVCDIINYVAIKGARGNALIPSEREVPSTGFKEAFKETVRFVYFLNLTL